MTPDGAGGPVLRGEALQRWLDDPEFEAYLREVVAEMQRLPTAASLQASQFWRREGRRIERILATVHAGGPASDPGGQEALAAAPPVRRLVHWNVYKGVALDEIARRLREDPALRGADAVLLNEIDVGMARSSNLHGAAELGRRLGLHWAFVPSYLELTKGPGADALAPGANRLGLHGVAVLTRRPPRALRAGPLPEAFDTFAFSEKRYGRRTALLAALGGGLVVGSAHLEVRGTPAGRRAQAAALVEAVEAFTRDEAQQGRAVRGVILAGDLNTHTFARGGLRRGLGGLARIALTPRGRLHRQLMEPWRGGREPLFEELRRAGFDWERHNDRRPTAAENLERVEELELLPRALRATARALLRRRVPLRLDWFAARGLPTAARPRRAATEGEWPPGPWPSDHLPIVLDLGP
jgi:endonuclease/exonuclease/phosphatase family metal-dependent hydrolase